MAASGATTSVLIQAFTIPQNANADQEILMYDNFKTMNKEQQPILERTGCFSSSSIHKLVSSGRASKTKTDLENTGRPFDTYIEEKLMEIRLGRQLENEINAKEVWWGKLVEPLVFGKLGIEYDYESKTRYAHPTITHWNGMPDTMRPDVVGDIKCPFSLKSFCKAVDSFQVGVEAFKEAKPDWYWQLVSNAILCNVGRAESIVYVPYQSALPEIREATELFDGDQNKVARFNWATDDDLPYLVEGGYYKDLNIFEFEVPQADIDFLTARVEMAVEKLVSQ